MLAPTPTNSLLGQPNRRSSPSCLSDRATFGKATKIGNDRRLEAFAPRLPQSFSTLYELAKFDDAQFDAAIKSGAVHPAVTRGEILALGLQRAVRVSQQKRTSKTKSRLSGLKALSLKTTDADKRDLVFEVLFVGSPEPPSSAPVPGGGGPGELRHSLIAASNWASSNFANSYSVEKLCGSRGAKASSLRSFPIFISLLNVARMQKAAWR